MNLYNGFGWAEMAIIFDEIQWSTLLKNGIDPDTFSNPEKLLEVIDDVIVENIVNNNDEPDRSGIALQRVYDRLRRTEDGGGRWTGSNARENQKMITMVRERKFYHD